MMKRNVGSNHWWNWSVLTRETEDKTKRPIFEAQIAQAIFEELRKRDLLDEQPGAPGAFMKYDLEGWDKAVSDGRPLYGFWLKFKRSWLLILLAFVFGSLLTALENRTVGLIDRAVDSVLKKSEQPNPKLPAISLPVNK